MPNSYYFAAGFILGFPISSLWMYWAYRRLVRTALKSFKEGIYGINS